MFNLKKKIIYATIIVGLIVFSYLLFRTDSEESNGKNGKKIDKELAFLLGGSSSDSNQKFDSKGNPIQDKKDGSIFDSDFYKAGKAEHSEKENLAAEEEDHSHGEIPINPQTGKPYPEETMQQFDRLRKKFPGNELIPKRMTPEEKTADDEKKRNIAEAAKAVALKKASPDDLKLYYDNQEKKIQDRMEIVKYLVDAQKESGSDDERFAKMDEVYEKIKKQAEEMKEQRAKAYDEAGVNPE